MEINNKKLLKNDWKKILYSVIKIKNYQEAYLSFLNMDYPTYEELKNFADAYSINVNFFYCDGEKRVNSDSELIIKGTHIDLTGSMIDSHVKLHYCNEKLSNVGKLTDKTTTYQLLYHFKDKTYGYNNKVVENIFTKTTSKNSFFEFLKNYTDYIKLPKETEYYQSVLNAAHSGEEFNTKSNTPEEEAYIDKLIDNNNEKI